jgi:hypothetical protein
MSCIAPSRYFLVTHETLRQDITLYGQLPERRYLIVPNEYQSDTLPFINDEPAKSVIELLKQDKLDKAKKVLFTRGYDKESMSANFAFALTMLFDGKFDSCTIFIKRMDQYSQNCFIQFITADCEYEKGRMSGSATFNNFLDKYQSVLDCSSKDDLHKELVKSRLKLIRYGY